MCCSVRLISTLTNLFLISAAMVMKACSTLVAFFALVSKKGMPISSAKACRGKDNQGKRATIKEEHEVATWSPVASATVTHMAGSRESPFEWAGSQKETKPDFNGHLGCLVVDHAL